MSEEVEFHSFEHRIWGIGEQIRQITFSKPQVRKNEKLQEAFLRISINKNAKRGRQSFILLLGYKVCSQRASDIVSQICDKRVSGHVIDTLLKMQASGFVKDVMPFQNSDRAWIRNKTLYHKANSA